MSNNGLHLPFAVPRHSKASMKFSSLFCHNYTASATTIMGFVMSDFGFWIIQKSSTSMSNVAFCQSEWLALAQ